MRIFTLGIILLSLLVLVNESMAKVEPPNYNFSLDSLKPFYPGNTLQDLQTKVGKGEKIDQVHEVEVHKFYVSQIRYKFPVFVQVFKGKILDFFAKLPSYFSHDLYHQSMINRFGKQQKFLKKESNAVYIWENQDGNRLIYSGTCTITCFPIFFAARPIKMPMTVPLYKPLIDRMN